MLSHARSAWRRLKRAARRGFSTTSPAVDPWKRFAPPYRLHVGCGPVHFDGWVNIDLKHAGAQDIIWDVSKSLPCPDSSCALIYNEHFLEHLAIPGAQNFMRECHRVLIPGGVARIAMPSLDATIRHYSDNTWKDQAWLKKYKYDWIKTRAEYINVCFRYWDHQWLYDAEELDLRLREAGFGVCREVARGISEIPELAGRETREESELIFEAVRD